MSKGTKIELMYPDGTIDPNVLTLEEWDRVVDYELDQLDLIWYDELSEECDLFWVKQCEETLDSLMELRPVSEIEMGGE